MIEIAENIINTLQKLNIDEIAVSVIEQDKKQIRFSNNAIDIHKNWVETSADLFLAKGKKTLGTTIKNFNNLDRQLQKFAKLIDTIPENKDYNGINPKKQTYQNFIFDKKLAALDDLVMLGKNAIQGALDKGAKRVAGTIYHTITKLAMATNYNSGTMTNVNLEIAVRAFNEFGAPGTSVFMTSDYGQFKELDSYDVGQEAAEFAVMMQSPQEGVEGKYDILFHPLCFGSLVSYSMHMLSAFQIDTGMSFFTNKLDTPVSAETFTIADNPTYAQGIGARIFDDEGTATKNTVLIKNGILQTYLHSYSTAQKFNTATTGNAGIIMPHAWQPVVEPGKRSYTDILAKMKKGLYIVNTWYTRFQDYRNGDFSTIPRDGIFYVENGEIVKSWKGVRISDNMLRIFSNIEELSTERRQVTWWDEVMPAVIPYVLVNQVNVTKAKSTTPS